MTVLKTSSSRMLTFAETLSEGLLVQRDGRIVYANRSALDLFGCRSRAHLVGTDAAALLHPQSREQCRRALMRSRSTGGFVTVERFLKSDGASFKAMMYSGTAAGWTKGTFHLVVGDTTEPTVPHSKSGLIQEHAQRLVEQLGIYAFDAQGRVIEANEAFCRLLGYSEKEMQQQSIRDLVMNEEARTGFDAEQGTELPGSTCSIEYRRKDGSSERLDTRIVSYPETPGLSFGVVHLGAAHEPTGDQDHRNQRQQALGVLAGGIAHDFNNVLTGLSGNLDLARIALAANELNRVAARLDNTQEALLHARTLIRQILSFSKGSAPLRRPTDLRQHVPGWISFALVGSTVSTTLDVAPALWSTDCDVHQIEQVVSNILINARQASPANGTISVRLFNSRKNGGYVALRVADQGKGIPVEIRNRLFDPFFTTKSEGTGLGLSTSLSIVRQHGGWISAANLRDGGAAFTVYLPRSKKPSLQGQGTPAVIINNAAGRTDR